MLILAVFTSPLPSIDHMESFMIFVLSYSTFAVPLLSSLHCPPSGFDCMFYKKADSDSFCDFLSRLYERHGRFVMFVDNASYHKSKKAGEALEGFGGDVIPEYFLPYTPELNPVEIQWKGIKRGTANVLHEGTVEMQESISAMLGNGEVRIVKMVDYLTP